MEDSQRLKILDASPVDGMKLLQILYGEPVRLAAAQRLNNEADIWVCVQDTFSDFYLQRNRFDPSKGSLRGYLVTISTRKAIRQWRENQRQWLASQASPAEADDIGAWERREQVNQALARLPELDARILRFKYYEGCSAREIAARLDMKYERVRKRLQRALKKLMQQMEL